MLSLAAAAIYNAIVLWAMRFYFVSDYTALADKRVVRWSAYIGTAAFWISFLRTVTSDNQVGRLIGVALLLIALFLFLASLRAHSGSALPFACSTEPPAFLVQRGPYRWVRHPVYASYLIAWLATIFLTDSSLMAAVFIWTCGVYFIAARKEEGVLAATFGAEYLQYVHNTGMFLPRVRR